jgi:hypothetical protein
MNSVKVCIVSCIYMYFFYIYSSARKNVETTCAERTVSVC